MNQGLSIVHEIRAFNRDYTKLIGLMNQHMLNSNFTLHELRILYEIQSHTHYTSKDLKTLLGMDGGYLSRVLKKLEKLELIQRKPWQEDMRINHLSLTEQGRVVLQNEIEAANQHINALINHLDSDEQMQLVQKMSGILSQMKEKKEPSTSPQKVTIRETIKTGDLGYLTYLHAKIYKEECGYDLAFEGYVCKTFSEFSERYSPEHDRFFIAEDRGKIVGCVAILGHSDSEAQLRWFLILPEYRGIGLGKELYQRAMAFCDEKDYKKIWLLTTTDQKKAVSMYTRSGFKLVSQAPLSVWGRDLIEERYELLRS